MTAEIPLPLQVRRDASGFAAAIDDAAGRTVLHLQPGTERNEEMVDAFLAMIERQTADLQRLHEERDGIRDDQQRAIRDNLRIGSDVWQRTMTEAAELVSRLGASEVVVRALHDHAARSRTERPCG